MYCRLWLKLACVLLGSGSGHSPLPLLEWFMEEASIKHDRGGTPLPTAALHLGALASAPRSSLLHQEALCLPRPHFTYFRPSRAFFLWKAGKSPVWIKYLWEKAIGLIPVPQECTYSAYQLWKYEIGGNLYPYLGWRSCVPTSRYSQMHFVYKVK